MGDTNDSAGSFFELDEIRALLMEPGRSDRFARLHSELSRQWRAAARLPSLRWLQAADLDDMIQEAWAKLLSPRMRERLADKFTMGTFSCVRDFELWTFVVFLNVARDGGRVLRRRPAEVELDESCRVVALQRSPERSAEFRALLEEGARVAAASGIENAEELYWLHFVEEWSDREIAEYFDTTRDAIAGRLKRLRAILRQALEAFRKGPRGDDT